LGAHGVGSVAKSFARARVARGVQSKPSVNETETHAFDRLAYVEQTLATLVARVVRLERVSPAQPQPHWQPQPRWQPPPPQHPDEVSSLETTLGTFWLSRIGIVSLITGTALLILTYFGELGPTLRVGLGYAIAGALAWAGLRLARRHVTFGRVVFGGGLAIAYFVTYALHFVPAMQVIESETLGVVLVALAIAAIVAIAHRMQSETVAGIALFLGLHTGMLSDVTALSLVCTTLLAAGAGFFLVANRWVIVPFSTVIAVYSTHATLALGMGGAAAIGPGLSLAFLGVDFLLFASASLIRPDLRARSLLALALLNWLGVIALGSQALLAEPRATLFAFLVGLALAQGVLAALARLRTVPAEVVACQLALALVTLALALPVRLAGWDLLLGWLGLALAAAGIARRAAWPAFSWLALGLLAVAHGYTRLDVLGAPAQLACVLALFATERVHAPRDQAFRNVLCAGVALGLLQLAETAVAPDLLTLGWVGVAFLLFAAGFALRSSAYRWGAFGVLALSALRFLAVQLRVLSTTQQILTFVVAGVVLLIVSFLYTRLRGKA